MTKTKEGLDALMKQTSLQIESPKVETILTKAGEALDGHATRNYKVRISYSMHFLKTDARRSYMEYQDLWMASDIEQQAASKLLVYFRPTGDSRIDKAWEHELAQIPGFALRQVTLRTEVNEEGNSTVLRTSREITKNGPDRCRHRCSYCPRTTKKRRPKRPSTTGSSSAECFGVPPKRKTRTH
jgi:hypothetical protein